MSRILCIDYGTVRCGIAVTDPLQIIAKPLTAVEAKNIISFLKEYLSKEEVELILVGEPKNLDDTDTHATKPVYDFVKKLNKEFPSKPVELVDERYTSKMATMEMVRMGMKKKDRQKKENKDIVAATLMLQEYLERRER